MASSFSTILDIISLVWHLQKVMYSWNVLQQYILSNHTEHYITDGLRHHKQSSVSSGRNPFLPFLPEEWKKETGNKVSSSFFSMKLSTCVARYDEISVRVMKTEDVTFLECNSIQMFSKYCSLQLNVTNLYPFRSTFITLILHLWKLTSEQILAPTQDLHWQSKKKKHVKNVALKYFTCFN